MGSFEFLLSSVYSVGIRTGLSICLIWGRNSAPFPMQNIIVSFFPNLDPKFSQFDSLRINWKKGEKNDKFE